MRNMRKYVDPDKLIRDRERREARRQVEANKPITKKKVIRRGILSLLFIAIGVFAVIAGLKQDSAHEEGLRAVEAEFDENVPYYRSGVEFQYWFSGSVSQNRIAAKDLGTFYGNALKSAYIQLDPANTYPDWTNLATINQNLGKEITVSKELYDALADGLEKTKRGEGYSIFNGVTYAEWESLRYLDDPVASDPVTDAEMADRLARLSAAASDLSNFNLQLLDDEACKVRFTVNQSYLDLMEELEVPNAPILDFNTLRDAWKLQLVADRLESQGYRCGYLVSQSGISLALSKYQSGGEFCMYARQEDKNVPAAIRSVHAGSCTVQLRAFPFAEEGGFYSVEQDGKTLLRHPWLPVDGSFRETLFSCMVGAEGVSAPELCYDALRLFACESDEAAKTLSAALNHPIALQLRSQPETVFYTHDSIQLLPDSGISGQKLS